ncbi:MAG: CBS domain-containing protein [Gallionellaceae bacterium]|nr:CBS domain-containing protein [Gallionellaceae bacterium]
MAALDQLTLADIVTSQVVTVTPDCAVETAVRRMVEQHVSCLLVLENGRPVGILTERDVVCLAHDGIAPTTSLRGLMGAPVVTATADLDFRSGHLLLMQHGIRHLVVVDALDNLVGIVSESDFRGHLGRDVYERLQNLDSVTESGNILLAPDTPLSVALAQMVASKLEYVIVAEQGHPLGILTERDLPRLLATHPEPAALPLREVMSAPLLSIPVGTSVGVAVERMAASRVRHMAVLGAAGDIVGVVSQHRLLEQLGVLLLEESHAHLETRLQWLLEATGVGTWEYDHASGRLNCSGTLCAMLHGEPTVGEFSNWLRRLLAADQSEATYCSADFRLPGNRDTRDDARWISLRGQTTRHDAAGQPLLSAGIAIDVSGAKRLRRDLEDERARLRTLVRTIPDLIWLKDTEGVYLDCNPMFERFVGLGEADIVGKTDYDFVERELADSFREHDRKAILTDGPSVNEEWVVFADDGHRALLETIKLPMRDAEGRLVGVLGIARDITANRQYQEQLASQIAELRRWQDATLGREMRILELKREVNALLAEHGQLPRYGSAETRGKGQ